MPTPYTGNPTAVEAPSSAPGPGVAPIVNLVVDGDTRNAASLSQQHKVLADFVAWLTKPTAIATSWAQETLAFCDAGGRKRFRLDHMAMPGGHYSQVFEDWRGSESLSASGSSVFVDTRLRWQAAFTCTGAGSLIVDDPDITNGLQTRHVRLDLGTGGGDSATLLGQNRLAAFNNAIAVAMDFDVTTFAQVNQMHFAVGLFNQAGNETGPSAGFGGCGFVKADSDGFWQFVSGDGTALAGPTDTTVLCTTNTTFRMRIEFWGSTIADDGAAAVRFYINEVLVGTKTTNLPSAATPAWLAPFMALTRDSGTSARSIAVGPIRIGVAY